VGQAVTLGQSISSESLIRQSVPKLSRNKKKPEPKTTLGKASIQLIVTYVLHTTYYILNNLVRRVPISDHFNL